MTKPEMLESIMRQLGKLRDPAGYLNAGIPNYDHLFGRDSAVSALQMLHREPAVALATLKVLAKFQGRRRRLRREEWPGKILHEHYPYGLGDQIDALIHNDHRLRLLLGILLWRFPYYGTVDAAAWYLILLHHYHAKTGDDELVRELWPTVDGIVRWLDRHAMRKTGLVTFRSHFIFGLKNQSWKDTLTVKIEPPVAMVEVQGYYYYALGLTAQLAEGVMHDPAAVTALRGRAERLKGAFRETFVPVDGVFPTVVDGNGRGHVQPASNPGHLLFSGLLTKRECDLVVKQLMAPEMVTPFGIRTEATSDPSFDPYSYQNGSVWPFDNWVIHQGLVKTGYAEEAATLKAGMTQVFERWGKLPELYAVELGGELHPIKDACTVQAWSAGALVNLLDEAPVL
jgi:glycogen debranching enzyme